MQAKDRSGVKQLANAMRQHGGEVTRLMW